MPKWMLSGVHPPEAGHALRVQVDGRAVAIFNVGGRLLAIDAACSHVGGPLDRGTVTGSVVTCPLHGSQFDVGTGQVVRGPATRALRAYRISTGTDALIVESD